MSDTSSVQLRVLKMTFIWFEIRWGLRQLTRWTPGGRGVSTARLPVRRDPARGCDAHAGENAQHTLAMCWRQVSKLQKTFLIVLTYLTIYLLVSYALTPDTRMMFVRDEMRIGDKFAFVYVAARAPVFTDTEGAAVFQGCGNCYLTNNKGFLPISEYDAVLVHGDRSLLMDAAFMDPAKRYLLESSHECITSKFKKCRREPKITSFSSKESYDLCSLCESLLKKRL
ncbi:unnamed protein product [Chilo suppressalis]|uniref:Uncharacterized protein n=1 Tax=Chilo suppressalis TaxID=168631 RepID=A0ABN8B0C0_CHISP|nr:unnamed protein product [Chilo suppressalis]